jgi:hypothetical protein
MTPEIQLLDQLSTSPVPYLAIEQHVFGGDRDFALNTVLALTREGKVIVTQSDKELPLARMEVWARDPWEPATIAALGSATVDITEAGLDYFLEQ